MIWLIVPVMPGIVTWLTGVPGGHVDLDLDALARDQDDGDGMQLCRGGNRGHAKAGRSGDERDDSLPSFHIEYASPRAPRGASDARD